MSTYYLGRTESWDEYLKAISHIKDVKSEIRRSSRLERFVISRQTQEIIASKEALVKKFGEGFDSVNNTLDRGFGRLEKAIAETKGSIEDLKASFDYNFALILDQLQLQNETSLRILEKLESIHSVLENPLLTQARELFRIGCERLIKGLLDKALDAFLKSAEKDETNFMTQLLIGKLYLYGVNDECNVIDLEKAREHLMAAARYARAESKQLPEARKYAGEAYLHAAISMYAQANMLLRNGHHDEAKRTIRQAFQIASEATRVHPTLSEGHYHKAKFAALLGDGKHASESLEQAINMDENYCLRVDADPDFYQIRDDVDGLFIQLRDKSRNRLMPRLEKCEKFLTDWHYPTVEAKHTKAEMKNLMDEAKRCVQRNTYFDYQQAHEILQQVEQLFYSLMVHRFGLQTLSAHTGRITCLAFNQTQTLLVSGGGDRTIHVWKLPENQHLFSLQGHDEAIVDLVFSHDGQAFASVDKRGNIKLWHAQDGSIILELPNDFGPVHHLAFSPDDRFLAAGCFDRVAVVWDLENGTLLHQLRGHKSSVDALVFSPNGKYLATGSPDNTAVLWDLRSGQLLRTFYGCSGLANSIAFSNDSRVLISGSNDGSVRFYNVADGTLLSTFPERQGAISWISLSPDHQKLATINFGKALQLWDLNTGRLLYNLKPFSPGINALHFSPDGSILAATDYQDQSVKLWNIHNGQLMHVIAGNLTCIGFSPDGTLLVTGDETGSLKFWGRMIKPHRNGRGSTIPPIQALIDWKKRVRVITPGYRSTKREARPGMSGGSGGTVPPPREGHAGPSARPQARARQQVHEMPPAAERPPRRQQQTRPAFTAPSAQEPDDYEEKQRLIEERIRNGECYVCGRKLGMIAKLAGIKLCHKHYFHF